MLTFAPLTWETLFSPPRVATPQPPPRHVTQPLRRLPATSGADQQIVVAAARRDLRDISGDGSWFRDAERGRRGCPRRQRLLKVLKVLKVLNFSGAGWSNIFSTHRRKGDSERRHPGWTGGGAQSLGREGPIGDAGKCSVTRTVRAAAGDGIRGTGYGRATVAGWATEALAALVHRPCQAGTPTTGRPR